MKLSSVFPAAQNQPATRTQPYKQTVAAKSLPDEFVKTSANFKSIKTPLFAGGCTSRPAAVSPMELIHASANNLSKAEVESLLRDIYIDASDGEDNTALMIAVKRGDKRMTKILTELGANATIPNRQGDFPLQQAALLNRIDLAQIILDSFQIDRYSHNERSHNLDDSINQKDGAGRTALMAAANSGQARMVKFLLDKGTDRDEVDNNRQTALMLATRRRDAIRTATDYTAAQRNRAIRNFNDVIGLLTPKIRHEEKRDDEKIAV